jgi:hypothetical protein
LFDVNTELGLTRTAQIGLLCTNVRTLFGTASGAVGLQTGYGKANCAAPSSITYSTPGTYTWTAPAGVNHVSVVAIGGGGGGTTCNPGGGGGLTWKNNISVTPGTGYQVVVGSGGARANACVPCYGNHTVTNRRTSVRACSGSPSNFNCLLNAGAGTGGYAFNYTSTSASGGCGTSAATQSCGGNGGNIGGRFGGGSGAGGYTGRGGSGNPSPPCYYGYNHIYSPLNNFCSGGGQAGATHYRASDNSPFRGVGGGGTGVTLGKSLTWNYYSNFFMSFCFGPAINGGYPGSAGQHGGYGGPSSYGGGTGNVFSSAYNGPCWSYCASVNLGAIGDSIGDYYDTSGGAYGGGGGTGCKHRYYVSYYGYYCSYNHYQPNFYWQVPGGQGGSGVVRILWNGNSRSFPCTSTGSP